MGDVWGTALGRTNFWAHLIGMSLIALSATAMTAATVLAATGLVPWPEIPVTFGTATLEAGGAILQIGVTALLLLLCIFIPGILRVLRLEVSHRNFRIAMDDVTRAYRLAHAADREGAFTLSREYDAVRERLEFLRAHPDLEALDAEVLELAAKMGHEARELARIYSEDKVRRARESIEARRHLADELDRRISEAHGVTADLRRALDAVEIDEDMVRARLARLRAEIAELTPPDRPGDMGPEAAQKGRRARLGVVPGE